MHTAVGIINWNSGKHLRPCIESLLSTAPGADILVVDNASRDRSPETVDDFRNQVTIIRNSVNRGFAAAANQVFQSTSSAYVLIVNPDVRALPGAVSALESFLHADSRAGAAGGYVNEKYLPKSLPTAAGLILENLGLKRRPAATGADNSEAVRVDQPAAAALMIRREAYDDIGGFDEQFYPAWYEDVDFCRRLKTAGWAVYFLPRAEFVHEGGYSAEALGFPEFIRIYYGNQIRYARKHFGKIGAAAVRASIAAGMTGRMAGRPKRAFAYARVLIGAVTGWPGGSRRPGW